MPVARPPVSVRDHSWVALLASTVGLEDFGRSRIRVRGIPQISGEVRVVVQLFGADARPLGAAERVVSALALRAGVDVHVVYEGGQEPQRALAWIEPNSAELEFGALTAKPSAALAMGSAAALGDRTVVELVGAPGAAAA